MKQLNRQVLSNKIRIDSGRAIKNEKNEKNIFNVGRHGTLLEYDGSNDL
ncbi:MAG: hypothetical protein ACI97N_000923 [Cognaticolwellia sp.]|jgi:hypothetical protein|tara:strand:- start:478 stop:624 length:147 start_codon:yes stop_codon:yes gene_type:complete